MIPPGEVLTKEDYEEQGKQLSEFATEVAAQEYGNPENTIHPIVKVLTKSKAKNKTVLQILIDSAGFKYNSDYNLILNRAGNVILSSTLLECFGLNSSSPERCPVCGVPMDLSLLLFHIQGTLDHGHKLSTEKTIKLFQQEWWRRWRWYDGKWDKK